MTLFFSARAAIRDTYPLTPITARTSRNVAGTILAHQFGVSFEKTHRFVNPMINEEGILELSLANACPLWYGRRIGAFHKERKRPIDP